MIPPHIVEQLRATEQVRGVVAGQVVYSVHVSPATVARLMALAAVGATPPDLTWLVHAAVPPTVDVLTNKPEFLIDLQQKVTSARQ